MTALLLAACASVPETPPPAWVSNVWAEYPFNRYAAARGSGKDRLEAETQALTALAFIFEADIQALRSRTVNLQGSIASEYADVESNVILFAVRYEEPWYYPAQKTWETVAYIDRNEAWRIYEPTVQQRADTFMNLITAAKNEEEPFNEVLRLGTASAYARSGEYDKGRTFALTLHPSAAERLFADADRTLAALTSTRGDAQKRAVISIQCPLDHNNLVYEGMVRALTGSSFAVTPGSADTVCTIQVTEGKLSTTVDYYYAPSMTIIMSGKTGPLMSFSVKVDSAGATTPERAKERAYRALAQALEAAFAGELERWQAALIDK